MGIPGSVPRFGATEGCGGLAPSFAVGWNPRFGGSEAPTFREKGGFRGLEDLLWWAPRL